MAICIDYHLIQSARPTTVTISVRVQLFAALLMLAALTTKVWITMQCTGRGYELARQRSEMVALDMERRELELKLSVLLRPDTLAAEASRRLGLQPLRPEQARRLVIQAPLG